MLDQMLAMLPNLRAFAMSLSGNIDQADDLAQETLLRALTHIDSFTQTCERGCSRSCATGLTTNGARGGVMQPIRQAAMPIRSDRRRNRTA
jgi:hypothetical protein